MGGTARLASIALLLPCAALGQSLAVGDRVDVPGLRVPPPRGCDATAVVLVPAARLCATRAARAIERMPEDFHRVCYVFAVLEDGADPAWLPSGSAVDWARATGGGLRARLSAWIETPSSVHAVVLDREQRLLTVTAVGAELCAVVEEVAAGRIDVAVAGELAELRAEVQHARQSHAWGVALARAARLRAAVPGLTAPWLAELERLPLGARVERRWLAEAVAAVGAERSAALLQRALGIDGSLAREPWIAAHFGERAAADRSSGEACLARFEFHAAREEDRGATGWGFAYLESCKGVAPWLAAFAERLGRTDLRGRFTELRLTALDLALRCGDRESDLELVERKLDVLAKDVRDWVGAGREGRLLVTAMRGDARALNSFAWRMLTEEPFRGHMQELALHAARAMESDASWRTYWRVDTLALAEFENGNYEQAVRLQEEAVRGCDAAARERYEERLETYRRALSTAPAPAGR